MGLIAGEVEAWSLHRLRREWGFWPEFWEPSQAGEAVVAVHSLWGEWQLERRAPQPPRRIPTSWCQRYEGTAIRIKLRKAGMDGSTRTHQDC
jgi:hypothetical protein